VTKQTSISYLKRGYDIMRLCGLNECTNAFLEQFETVYSIIDRLSEIRVKTAAAEIGVALFRPSNIKMK